MTIDWPVLKATVAVRATPELAAMLMLAPAVPVPEAELRIEENVIQGLPAEVAVHAQPEGAKTSMLNVAPDPKAKSVLEGSETTQGPVETDILVIKKSRPP